MKKDAKNRLALFASSLSGVIIGSMISTNFGIAGTTDLNQKNKALVKNLSAERISRDFVKVSKDVTPAVVSIVSTRITRQEQNSFSDPLFQQFFGENFSEPPSERKEQGLGSGVIVDTKGLILTNNHVIEGADEIKVILADQRKFKAKVLGRDKKTDLAVLKIENAENLPVAKLGNSDELAVGEWVLAIGNPLGFSSTVTSGIISAKDRANVGIVDYEDFIQTDAAINPGNSGGALVNLKGEVVGINTAIASRTGGYMGIGFAIPANMADKIMKELIDKGKVSRGYMGIQIQNVDASLSKSLRLKEAAKGLVIGKVEENSPAEKAGLQTYDVIISLNAQKVENVTDFREKIANTNPGSKIKLGIIREGKELQIGVRLGEMG